MDDDDGVLAPIYQGTAPLFLDHGVQAPQEVQSGSLNLGLVHPRQGGHGAVEARVYHSESYRLVPVGFSQPIYPQQLFWWLPMRAFEDSSDQCGYGATLAEADDAIDAARFPDRRGDGRHALRKVEVPRRRGVFCRVSA